MSDDDALEAAINTQRQVNSAVRTTPPKAPGAGEVAKKCGFCPHPEHRGLCTRRNGGTAYACPCHHDAPTPPPAASPCDTCEPTDACVPVCRAVPAASPGTDASGTGLLERARRVRDEWERTGGDAVIGIIGEVAAWLRERAKAKRAGLRNGWLDVADAIEEEVIRGR